MDRSLSQDHRLPEITPNLCDSVPHLSASSMPPSVDNRLPNLPSLTEMASIEAVEKILNYNFTNKNHLVEALTHSSYTDSPSLDKLALIGKDAIDLAFATYVRLTYSYLKPHQLTLLKAANVSTEKLARVAINHGLYQFLRRNTPSLDAKVLEFSEAVSKEDYPVTFGGSVKAPKVLADIVQSVAGAICIDLDFDINRFWVIFRGILEPIVIMEDFLAPK